MNKKRPKKKSQKELAGIAEHEKKQRAEIRHEIGLRIGEFRETLGLGMKEFAESFGIEYFTELSYERGRAEPGGAYYAKLRETYPLVDIGYLLTGKRTIINGMEEFQEAQLRRVPVVDRIPAEGFSGEIPPPFILSTSVTMNIGDPKAFALLVRTSSMLPDVKEGDEIIVTPVGKTDIKDGKVYLVSHPSAGLLLCRIYRNGRSFSLIPNNPELKSVTASATDTVSFFSVIEYYRRAL